MLYRLHRFTNVTYGRIKVVYPQFTLTNGKNGKGIKRPIGYSFLVHFLCFGFFAFYFCSPSVYYFFIF